MRLTGRVLSQTTLTRWSEAKAQGSHVSAISNCSVVPMSTVTIVENAGKAADGIGYVVLHSMKVELFRNPTIITLCAI